MAGKDTVIPTFGIQVITKEEKSYGGWGGERKKKEKKKKKKKTSLNQRDTTGPFNLRIRVR